ncbi:MAG: hypothetical protein WDM77_09740 [Steroidobacteraceae bacterium]
MMHFGEGRSTPVAPFNASVTDPRQWLSFDTAARGAYEHCMDIGYVLTADDPFTCIDLDWCNAMSQVRKGDPVDPSKFSTQADADRFLRIVEYFSSYTERSTSGNGLHIWVKGKIGAGLRARRHRSLFAKTVHHLHWG